MWDLAPIFKGDSQLDFFGHFMKKAGLTRGESRSFHEEKGLPAAFLTEVAVGLKA